MLAAPSIERKKHEKNVRAQLQRYYSGVIFNFQNFCVRPSNLIRGKSSEMNSLVN